MTATERAPLPNSLPRPPGELDELEKVWAQPRGWRLPSAVNNTYIGLFYIGAALLFLVLGGVLALLMRTQLAVPENDFLDHDTYNQFFTMHGSVMMFLFAVPVVEAIAILLLPAMLGARDLPFPRLSAYAFWAYFIGGLVFFGTLFFDLAPDGGWFMYPPLTGAEYSPGLRTDFWLLGIGFIEISAIAGAIEIVVGILRTRPPGMTLARMPVYAWAMLVVGAMIIFAFPPVIAATALLELERAFDWPFFVAERGGDPVLWQHLFWLFGHPDVYIIFLPAAGLVSMIVPAMAQRPLVGYKWIVMALVATGAVSFALWVHHMFAVGMPHLSAGLFSAASMTVAIPAGIQVFAWIATLRTGRVRLHTPTWFMLGFFGVFVLGGLTGVMLAAVPFDWQAHDTYFVVAHLHYVLIGGMLFPVMAAIYYWTPMVSGRQLSARMGKWACGLMFGGVNLAFFPMHISGMLGMPRRVWTYSSDLGWDAWNMLSTAGAFVLAAGIALVLLDLILHLRPAGKVNANPWHAGSLEWLPTDNYGVRSIPRIESRDPLWQNPQLREEVGSGQHFLPGVAAGTRESIVTSAVDARPEYLLRLPGPGWLPMIAGIGTAVFFFALTLKQAFIAWTAAAIVLASVLRWLWDSDPPPGRLLHDIGGGVRLPDYMAGSRSHAWWAVIVLMLVNGTVFASLVFGYFYLWTVDTQGWPPPGTAMPLAGWSWTAAIAGAASHLLATGADKALRRGSRIPLAVLLGAGMVATWATFAASIAAIRGAGIGAEAHAFGATIHALLGWQGLHVLLLTLMIAYTLARHWRGMVDHRRRVTFDSTWLIWHFTAAQGLLLLAVAHSARLGG